MPLSVYDDNLLTDEQKRQVSAYKQAFQDAQARGDQQGMASAHTAAEKIRAGAGYSGGADGSYYNPLEASQGYSAATLPSYQAQEQRVNDAYNAARSAQLAALKSAYDANTAALENTRAQIEPHYQQGRNMTAAESERARQAFNEYAAASGLNSGAGGQAELARNSVLQGNLNALNTAEANAKAELDNQLAQLKVQYQNDIAAAIARGEYERAAALMREYQTAEQSRVAVAQAQSDENYRAWGANYGVGRDTIADERYNNELARSAAEQEAATRAKYGDFSGYSALGYDDAAIANMTAVWNMQNPLLAYNTGRIGASEYHRLTGRYPAGYGGSGSGGANPGRDATADGMGAVAGALAGLNTGGARQLDNNMYRSMMDSITDEFRHTGDGTAIINTLDRYWAQMSAEQRQRAQDTLGRLGLAYVP